MKKKPILGIALCVLILTAAGLFYVRSTQSVDSAYKTCKAAMVRAYPGQGDLWGSDAQRSIDECMSSKGYAKVTDTSLAGYRYE